MAKVNPRILCLFDVDGTLTIPRGVRVALPLQLLVLVAVWVALVTHVPYICTFVASNS
jgi:hypothetical protein